MGEQAAPGKFALIGHPPDAELFRTYMKYLKPDKTFDDDLIIKLFEWTPAYKVKEWKNYSLDYKEFLSGIMIMVPFLPEMKDIKIREVTSKIEQALSIAKENNCTVASLGAFTSIVIQGRERELADKYQIKLTSGNTLTAALTIKSIEEITNRLGIDLHDQTMGIIGASGDIGGGCVGYFCDKVKKMVLSARGIIPLKETINKHKNDIACEIEISEDNLEVIKKARIIIFATSAYQPLFSLDDFRSGTIVCDVSSPLNVKSNGRTRNDIFLFHGGIASIPMELNPGFDIGTVAVNTFYGCQIEGIMIAQDDSMPCSWGRGNISREKIGMYLEKIRKNPYLHVAFTEGNWNYTDQELNKYKKRWDFYRRENISYG
ncbi:hypothetical protein ACFL5V_00630 [Fibrobacterota bacterium]